MSHKDAPPETAEQKRMREFYTARGVECGWGRDKDGNYFAPYARDAWAAWQEASTAERLAKEVRECHCSHCRWLMERVAADSAEAKP